ncbi:hypothetical protein Y1Q_0011420 [Alligator mississippiensis]|uniref:Reverse transcriptase RNase H-like domain-containing protein n=1 Tax=Alligator mississippiensis TaxID=8496 RepID=A0A151PBA2_ALLMI|nr:hypothetical protein Y1Q_0011420 [Alligator mississippiensis]
MAQSVTDYCKSCETCQRTGKSGDKQRAPVQPLLIIEHPFYRVGIDLVGLLRHWTHRGKKYILTLVNFATRYPVAVALTSTKAPVLADASDMGLGAALLQEHEGNQHPTVYLSRKLIPWEHSLSSGKKECLAIVWALNKFWPYLWGQPFIVLLDHVPLQWLQMMQNTNAKLQRQAWQLQEFNFTIEHLKGSQNMTADALS